MQSPKLKFWMSQLELLGAGKRGVGCRLKLPLRPLRPRLEYHDLLSLFEFLDNGDGQITPLVKCMGGTRCWVTTHSEPSFGWPIWWC